VLREVVPKREGVSVGIGGRLERGLGWWLASVLRDRQSRIDVQCVRDMFAKPTIRSCPNRLFVDVKYGIHERQL
jgi:hypothetical protein